MLVDLPVDPGERTQVIVLVGLLSLAFASFVFVPVHVARKRLGRALTLVYLIAGTLIPACLVMVMRPVDQNDVVANLILAVSLSVIGGCTAIGFSFTTGRFQRDRIAGR